jgi:cytochrome P450
MTAVRLDELELPLLDFEDPEVASNPFDAARSVARDSWVARVPAGYILVRHDECSAVAKDRRFRTPEGLGLIAQGVTSDVVIRWASETLLGLDGEQHRRIRRLALPAFTPQKAEQLRGFSSALIRDVYQDAVKAGRGEVAALNNEFVVRVICKVLGFPDSDWALVSAWADAVNQVISVSVLEQIPRIEKAILELNEYTADQIADLRKNPVDSLGSALIAAEEEGDRLSHEELVALFETLLMAGAETTQNMLSLGMWLFARHPEPWSALATNPDLALAATEELLRFRPPFIGTARLATEDVELNGTVVRAGTQLILGLPGANFDRAVFESPELFDIHRFDGTRTAGHLSFGIGMHFCLGAHLARVEMTEAFGYLPSVMRGMRVDPSDPNGVGWSSPFGVHGPIRLPLHWDQD